MRKVICLIILFYYLFIPIYADYQIDTTELEKAINSEYNDYIGDQTIEKIDVESGFKELYINAFNIFKDKLKKSVIGASGIVICSVVISISSSFVGDGSHSISAKVIDYTGVLVTMFITLFSNKNVLNICSEAISNIDHFSKILTPIYALAAAISYYPITSVATAGGTLLFTNIITNVTSGIIFPAINFYAVIYAAGIMSGMNILTKICELIKWFITLFFKIILIIFTAYISISGIVSSSADLLAVKTTKTIISSSIPFVGSIIADVSDTFLTGAGVIKAGIGTFGFLGICAMCLVPVITAFVYYLVYKVFAALSGSLCNGGVSKMLEGISSSYGLAIAALGSCCAIQFISIVIIASVTSL